MFERLDKAYKAFFRRMKSSKDGKAGFPRFRGQLIRFLFLETKRLETCLYIKNVGRFKLFLSRPIEGKIKTVNIRKTSAGKWFVCFSCDGVPSLPKNETKKAVGIVLAYKLINQILDVN